MAVSASRPGADAKRLSVRIITPERIAFDQPADAESPALAPFFHALRAAVDRSLSEGGVP